jgi:iron complex outermembrane receptor protein
MFMTKTQITGGLRGGTALSALVLAGTLFAAPAMAQDSTNSRKDAEAQTTGNTQSATPQTGDQTDVAGNDIVVTGSILRRTDAETPSPVTVLSSEALDQRGINTVAEAVQRISANGAGAMTQGWNTTNNFATGANAVSLRGLTVQSTLSIFDGLRMAPYPLADDGHRNFVDLNTLPDAVVDRIEILRDGASSTYGADAIAGVVNVIMKKEVKGIHANASAGVSSRGDAPEQRVDLTVGYGDLDQQGFNMYLSGEYQRQDTLFARDRQYPINSSDLSKICQSGSTTVCMANGVQFGINADGTLGTGTTTTAALVAPATAAGTRTGAYRLLDPNGCFNAGLTPVTLTAAQAGTTWAPNQCQQDTRNQYQILQPQQERYGFVFRATANVGDRAQAYATASFYNVNSVAQTTPTAYNNQTTPPTVVLLNPIVLPVFVCPTGVGTIAPNGVNTSTGCTAANGTLNPNNPFAAAGGNAILRARYDRPYTVESNARSLRGAFGISGGFGDNWTYSADFTISNVKLDLSQRNMLIPQRVADVVARGTYNFANPSANSEAMRNYIAPENRNTSNSDLWQAQATIGKELFALPGGPLQAAVGLSYRHESINNPSANPDNTVHPYDRYYTINAVGAIGSRNVKSAFYEIGAPVTDFFELNASGRYDDYSSGQSNFSPKFGAKFTPIRQIALRGTWSKGFRIPSFNEAYGLPTTGYSTSTVNCGVGATYTAFCAAHSPNGTPATANSYATAPYSVGTTNVGNPALRPEKSRSITAGVVFEPVRNVSFTIDYWNIRVKDLVSSISAADTVAATNQYYLNNGVVTVPGVTAIAGVPDPQFPGALPSLGFLQVSFQNADSEQVSGLDFGANARIGLGGVTLQSSLEASYLMKYEFTQGGQTLRYDGTLSPCDYTSCSGSPKWRGSWQNTLDFGDFDLTGTVYYTSPFNLWAVDYGEDSCAFVGGQGIKAYKGTTIPVQCRSKPVWNFDLSARVRVNDQFTLYANALNVLDIKAPLDVSAAYGLSRYNPAWAQANAIGRFFRVGAKVDF